MVQPPWRASKGTGPARHRLTVSVTPFKARRHAPCSTGTRRCFRARREGRFIDLPSAMLTTSPNNSLTRLRALSAHLRMDGQAPSLATRGDCAATSLSLDGKVVLVTGGGDGIGGGMVRGFSEAGATVFYCDLKEHTDPPPGATFIHCDGARPRCDIAYSSAGGAGVRRRGGRALQQRRRGSRGRDTASRDL